MNPHRHWGHSYGIGDSLLAHSQRKRLVDKRRAEIHERILADCEEAARIQAELLTQLHKRELTAPTRISSKAGALLWRDIEHYLAFWELARKET